MPVARKPFRPIDFDMIDIQFCGGPRLRAGTGRMRREAATVGQPLRALGRACPALEDPALDSGTVPEWHWPSRPRTAAYYRERRWDDGGRVPMPLRRELGLDDPAFGEH
jgi:hypothetical protein